MHVDILVILCLVVVGVAAFFVGILYAVCHALASVRRGILRLVMPRGRRRDHSEESPIAKSLDGRDFRVCANERCRHVEHRPATYCSQCGERLDDED